MISKLTLGKISTKISVIKNAQNLLKIIHHNISFVFKYEISVFLSALFLNKNENF